MSMKNWHILLIFGVVILILYLLRKPINKTIASMTRGYKNNNPGNIRNDNTLWQGEVTPSTDAAFKQFVDMPHGYRAIFVNLRSYFNAGWNTITKIISHYAPSNENDTKSYISTVSQVSGIDPDQEIDFSDTDSLIAVVKGISLQENGIEADEDDIIKGFSLV